MDTPALAPIGWPSGVRLTEVMRLLDERCRLQDGPSERARPTSYRVKQLRWELERFAEMVAVDPAYAATLMHARHFYWALMLWRYKHGEYDRPGGHALHEADRYIKFHMDKRYGVM